LHKRIKGGGKEKGWAKGRMGEQQSSKKSAGQTWVGRGERGTIIGPGLEWSRGRFRGERRGSWEGPFQEGRGKGKKEAW